MQLDISTISILFASVSSVFSVPKEGWREISVGLERANGSAFTAAVYLGVKYISMLKAYEKIDTDQDSGDLYWVSFLAESKEGEHQECQGKVLWPPAGIRIVKSASCGPVTQ
ncbi:uncharacterized protein LOC123537888 [Mercenaria mercenaria]|uniref:uncharacterized protein LOC123537888 n=1 Tax=Mercenaria mercenaria TaxID=6596 RepID=UPI00234EF614|nr:uncharacterized protein LOC123537888 [Mercenaria mercenaria]